MDDFVKYFELAYCCRWIVENGFKKIAVQLGERDIKYSARISKYLDQRGREWIRDNPKPFEIYVTKSNSCCVDLLVTQHVTGLDAIIHLGRNCLSKPVLENQTTQLPILFSFGRSRVRLDDRYFFPDITNDIRNRCQGYKKDVQNCKICILYDTDKIDYAHFLDTSSFFQRDYVHVARLLNPSDVWFTTLEHGKKFVRRENDNGKKFDKYYLRSNINSYTHAIYIGRPSIHICLSFPELSFIDPDDKDNNPTFQVVNRSKILNKRIILVDRLKDEEEMKIGVIFTNPLPDITSMIERLETYSRTRKHVLYFITMIQTIDECKIGNFDLCDAFLVVNSCTCSTILESLVFNRPILTELEFKMACGFEVEYGGVKWPGTSYHLSEVDMINRRRVSDVSLALIHTRNELLERCSQARANKWSGLCYDKASNGSDDGDHDSLIVEKGLEGIASSYKSEPLKKVDSVELESIPEGCCSKNIDIASINNSDEGRTGQ